MVGLVSGLGGPRDFGESFVPRNDDESTEAVDITSIFGGGLDFFGTIYESLFINNNGSVTFTEPRSSFTPDVITATSNNPEITPFFGDVDTRAFDLAVDDIGNLPASPGGNSTGSNLVWYHMDVANDRFIVTWDDVGFYDENPSKLNAFQLIISDKQNSDFDIEFRYEDINWTTGDASDGVNGLGGSVARAGYTAGSGDPREFFELPQSGNEAGILDLETISGNTGLPGRWLFSVREGRVVEARLPDGPVNPLVGQSYGDSHLITFDGTPYDFKASGEFVLARETDGPMEIQIRQVDITPELSVNQAVATRIENFTVMFDARDASPLTIDGVVVEMEDFTTREVANSLIGRQGNVYTVAYAGEDGILNDGDDRMIVEVSDNFLNVRVEAGAERSSLFEGLLSDGDGNSLNDIMFADGQSVERPLNVDQLYGQYLQDWRIDAADSLFTYDAGESPEFFASDVIPDSIDSINDLTDAQLAAVEVAAINAGLQPGTINYNNALLDFVASGNSAFLEAALDATTLDDDASINGRLTHSQAEIVAYLYEAGLNRNGDIDLAGLNFWIDAREGGFSEIATAEAFLFSPEFAEAFGDPNTLNDQQLVETLYLNVLDREGEEAGVEFWTTVAGQPGYTRPDLLLAFAESPENVAGSTFVTSLTEVAPGEWDFA